MTVHLYTKTNTFMPTLSLKKAHTHTHTHTAVHIELELWGTIGIREACSYEVEVSSVGRASSS